MAEMSPLRRRMVEDMTIRNLSPATQQSYIHAVSKFSRYCGHSPDRLGLEDVRAYQVYLISKGISWASLNQIVCALRFFYGVTLGYEAIPERIAYAREPRKLPAVLSAGEVVRFLEAVSSLKARVALTTAYAAGLRVSEVVGRRRPTSTATAWSSGLNAARAARSATSCCPSNCSASCAATGVSRILNGFCSRVATSTGRSSRPSCTPPAVRRASRPASTSA